MVIYLHLGVATLLFLLGVLVAVRGVRHARLLRTLGTLQPRPLGAPGLALRMAHATLEGGPLLRSPWQGRPCVYFFFRVLDASNPARLRTVATGKEWTLARIRDATATARVDGPAATVASPRRHEAVLERLDRIPPEKAEFFERAGIDEKHLARFDLLLVREYTLEPGDAVFVTGTLREQNGEKAFYRRKRSPLIVSADRDIGYLQGLRNEFVLYAALAPMILAAALVLGLLALA